MKRKGSCCEGLRTYNVDSIVRAVVDNRGGIEVRGVGNTNGNLGILQLCAVKLVQALERDGLLEINGVLLGHGGRGGVSTAVNGDAESLILEESSVELGEGFLVGDLDILADVDLLELVGIGLGEVQNNERLGIRDVREGQVAKEGVDVSLDSAISSDG